MRLAEILTPHLVERENTVLEAWSDKYKRSIDCSRPRGFSQRAHCADRKKNEDVEDVTEDSMSLHDWFGKGKHGGAGGGGWDRYNTRGERIGKCGERGPGEGKPKCLSKAKAQSLRASGGKAAIAAAVNKKRREDPNPERRGKADMVSNRTSKTDESTLDEVAVSGAQQSAAAIALQAKRSGRRPKPGTASASMMSMSTRELKKYAGTPRKNLPHRVSKS